MAGTALSSLDVEATFVAGGDIESNSVEQTAAAMRAGAPVIVQGALESNGWRGRADILRRVEKPSNFGAWSYEMIDTKLARETKGSTVLQLCLYSDLLAISQGAEPEYAYVVTPETDFQPEAFRIADYAAYYRRDKQGLEKSSAAGTDVGALSGPQSPLRRVPLAASL